MKQVSFSIIVVCLNAGEKLLETVKSVLAQDYPNYEIIVKDGGSSDGSVERLAELGAPWETAKMENAGCIKIFTEKDTGIYDAMNQAWKEATGDYVLFLNCGDSFPASDILKKTAEHILEEEEHGIYYGDTFCEKTQDRVAAPPKITPFACYRNIPCHQSCFYKRELFGQKKYNPAYRIRADYEHFLWCCLKEGVKPLYMDMVVASYEGGGYSENAANRKRDKEEHKLIVAQYFSLWQRFRYKAFLLATLAPLRRFLAESSVFSSLYNKIKAGLYK